MDSNSHHIIFDDNYLYKILKRQYDPHSSWELKASNNDKYTLGGKVRNSHLNNLIRFDKIPEWLDVKSVNQIEFGIDFELFFNCQIDGKTLSYRHQENEVPELITKNIKINNLYSNYPLKQIKVQFKKTPTELINQEWEGNCNRIGGKPVWVQKPEDLACPICKNKMKFIFQLDSGLADENAQNNYEVMFGNDGICYTFWCDHDKISSYIWQSS